MNRFFNCSSAIVLALVAAGCTTPVPQALKTTDVPAAGFTAPIMSDAQVWPKADWWTTFGSPEMAGMVSDAQANNLDIAAAYARVLQAEAQSGIARSSLFPTLNGSFDASRQGSHGRTISTGPGGVTTTTGRFSSSNSFSLGLDASYQLDIFGQNRNRYFSAEDALRASRYAQQTVALTVESNTARAYIKSGAMPFTVLWDPAALGYLTVWAGKQLIDGKPFQASNSVPGMAKPVSYDSKTGILLLGDPTVFTAKNVDEFKF